MTRIDRHIFTEWLVAFSITIGATLSILILEDIQDNMQDLRGYGASSQSIIYYYIILTPSLLSSVIPISLIISILFSLGNLHRNNEIIAMRAAGMSLWRISRTLWLVGAIFSFLLLYLNSFLIPWSVEKSNLLLENYSYANELKDNEEEQVGLHYNLAFYNHKDHRMWFFNRFSNFNYRGYGVTVSTLDSENREISRILAKEAYFDDIDGYWVFNWGREVTFNPEEGDAIKSLPFEEIKMTAFIEDPKLMKTLEKRPKDLSLFELSNILEKVKEEDNSQIRAYAVRYHAIWASPLSCLIVVGLAVPFAVAGVRVNPIIGVSKSMILFLLYFLMANISSVLGERAVIDPILAAWLPNALILLVGLIYHRNMK